VKVRLRNVNLADGGEATAVDGADASTCKGNTVLDRLDEIPWHSLHHAYGTAEDVPGLLRALAQEGEQQDKALYELFGNIWHQGTVYEASAYAVPFLVELAANPTVSRRDELLGLIGALAAGRSYLAVHAQPGLKIGEFFREKPDFEERLQDELAFVRRTRIAVLEHKAVIRAMLNDQAPMIRAGAAHVLSRFPEQVLEIGPLLRQAATKENDPLGRAALLWCLGALQDPSPEAITLLNSAVLESNDPRQDFAAAIALYRITGKVFDGALPICRQMAAAPWYAEGLLSGVPWDFSGEFSSEPLLAGVEPDPVTATRMLLSFLCEAKAELPVDVAITHDLLQLNFTGGEWRKCRKLTAIQHEVLSCLVETDAAWRDTHRLWFLVPDGATRISQLTQSDIEKVRAEMRSILDRNSGVP
jgi:hypothetical protein